MAGETWTTIIGNLGDDVELRYTGAGAAVANFRIASTPRVFDSKSKEYKDGPTLWMKCSIWRTSAENMAESLTKGMRVIAYGKISQRDYETSAGEKRSVIEFEVDEIGPSIKYATVKVNRTERGGSSGFPTRAQEAAQTADDPWATPATNSEPPF